MTGGGFRAMLARPFAALARVVSGAGAPGSSPRRRGAFAGAVFNRLTLDWVLTPLTSADQEQKGEMRTLRARARELSRNTSVGARFCLVLEQNIVGSGFRLQAKNYTSEGVLHRRANDAIEREWYEWARVGNCTMDGRHSLLDALNLAVRTKAVDGEWLVELVEGANNPWGFALNILDADLLDETLERTPANGLNEIRQGVEVDPYGRPLAYYLWERHPSDGLGSLATSRLRRRVPADRIVHLFAPRRPGQTRGVTAFAPVMMDQRMLAGYYEAELVAARVSSAKMGFIKLDAEEGVGDENTTPGAAGALPMDADPGSFWRGEPGESLEMFDPQHPVAAFGEFARAILHHLAAGLGISYGTLTGDLSQANYSSMRVGLLAEREYYRREQTYLVEHLLERVYRVWLKSAILFGRLPELTSADSSRWMRVVFQPRGFPWIDPAKELEGAGTELALGITTRTILAAERGRDLEEMFEGLEEEAKLAALYNVEPQTPNLEKTAPAAAPAPAADDKKDDEKDDAADADGGKPKRALHIKRGA